MDSRRDTTLQEDFFMISWLIQKETDRKEETTIQDDFLFMISLLT